MSQEQTKSQRKIRCVVTSDSMSKSRVAKIERLVKHPMLGKYMKKTTKLMFHDETNQTKVGDEVMVVQTKPLSARKKFMLHSVVKQANN